MPRHPTTSTTGSWSGRQGFPTTIRRRVLARATGCALAYPRVCTDTPREVDHTLGVEDARALGWTPEQYHSEANAQAVCSACHAVKTAAEQARGRARAQAARPRQRPTPAHPGLRRP